jgi:sec-independent protein translocase protein TatB
MNFIGIGYGEILIIIVAALIIFGPQKLPEVAGQAARWIRDAKKMMTDMTGEFERSAGMKEFKDAIEGEIKGVKKELEEAGISVKKDLNAAAGSANAAFGQASQSAKGGKGKTVGKSAATSGANKSATTGVARSSKPKASKADPYAGLVQLTDAAPKTRRAAPALTTSPNGNGSGAQDTSSEPLRETSEAVMRARERRLAAGYNRRISAP